ncbi:NAD(P)H-dependent FMN reductase [Andreprevotia lacus DSM 23236]|jgi:NAD(P)H-dependent FMN reductase|uniref:NAD(P)H-dependent FMN reductase n=1 Tax=Andreprevotia lacus DSM 23236 TaxID=1121001 RepID=A0A1W1X927_9NEIS|nr:NADPH-dependent FMN reductase [Andreprevotia lacus]SMC20472.1 NAD(P)H-dependent FMN reductase [Andreprevotia lacus DSM 23236]
MTTILTVCGSLRAASYNRGVLRALHGLAPAGVTLLDYTGLAHLPPFNPDHDADTVPAAVRDWRAALAGADAVLIASPEYAFGVPGALKNALDWVVSSGEFVDKPTAVVTASSSSAGGDKCNAALVQTLRVMSAVVDENAILTIAQVAKRFSLQGEILDPEHAAALRCVLLTLDTQTRLASR